MPRSPAENYHQLRGRRHLGLTNPEKFDLTYGDVVRLIDNGEWRNFYEQWRRKQKRLNKIKSIGNICPKCKIEVCDPKDWNREGTLCKECQRIQLKEKGVINGRKAKLTGRTRGSGKCLEILDRKFCTICRRWKVGIVHIDDMTVCNQCLESV